MIRMGKSIRHKFNEHYVYMSMQYAAILKAAKIIFVLDKRRCCCFSLFLLKQAVLTSTHNLYFRETSSPKDKDRSH